MTIDEIRLAAVASDAAYAPDREAVLTASGFRFANFIPCGDDAFVCSTADHVIAAFCGTRDPHGWLLDLSALFVRSRFGGKIHIGFSNYYEPKREEMDSAIRALQRPYMRLITCGHSLGATGGVQLAIDTLKATALFDHAMKVITFGGPRTGNGEFAQINDKFFRQHGVEYLRLANSRDLIPRVPLIQGRHFGDCGVLDADDGQVRMRSTIPLVEKLIIDGQLLAGLARAQYHKIAMAMTMSALSAAQRRLVAVEIVKFLLREHSMALYRQRVESPLLIQASAALKVLSQQPEEITPA